MKKLFAFIVVLLFSGITLAQSHVDVINQVGNTNSGIVTQSGAQSNLGEIYTAGNNNDGTILQNNNGFGGAGLEALVTQNGDHNHALVDQAHWTYFVPGQTFGHDAVVDQDGNWNTADIYQFNGQPSDAFIRQLGNTNDADQLIYSDGNGNNSAWIWQEGNNNIAYQNLGVEAFVALSTFTATQAGSDNKAYQYIYSDEPFPMATVNTNANNNDGVIATFGSNNYASQVMNFNASGVVSDNTATITQYNNWNTATQTQTGFGHTSTILQNGNSNIAQSVQN